MNVLLWTWLAFGAEGPTIECDADLPPFAAQPRLVLRRKTVAGQPTPLVKVAPLNAEGGKFQIVDPATVDSAKISMVGYITLEVELQGDHCSAGPFLRAPIVSGEVANAPPKSEVEICGTKLAVGPDGTFSGPIPKVGYCSVHAHATDPSMWIRLDGNVALTAGQDVRVDLRFPERPGFTGLHLRAGIEHAEVWRVAPSSAAAAAGIQPGTRVLSIDGENTGGRDIRELYARTLGEYGSEVSLVVLDAEGTYPEEVVLTRRGGLNRRPAPEEATVDSQP